MSLVTTATAMQPLNAQLYRLLTNRFGAVTIVSPGIGFRGTVRRVFDGRELRNRYEPDVAGEYYRINCPYCNDTRQRLWVNHMYGQPDPANAGRRLLWLAVCYNEQCLEEYDNSVDFENRVFGHLNRDARGKFRVLPGLDEAAVLKEVAMPGTMLPLTRLSQHHTAVQYLEERGFTCQALETLYGVSFCLDSDMFPVCAGRIIIPIYMHGELVGWQARFPGERDWSKNRIPKYYGLPGMPKRLMLYNYDRAKQYRTVVIVEGVTDVWKVGGPAVALLGKKAHPLQRKLLSEFDAAVLALDPDASEDAAALLLDLRRIFSGRVGLVTYPDGIDAGSLTREENWDLIYAAADEAGLAETAFERCT